MIFEKINNWIQSAENSFVNLVSAIAPWLAPISPAYMTFQHATETLNFPFWVAMPVSVVVEILGFSAVSTFMSFWFFNRRNSSKGKRAPVGFVVFAFFFYLALIVTSNILLDTFPDADWAKIAARALFALQTIPAALIVISRTGHKSLLEEIANEKRKANEDTNGSANVRHNDEQETNDSPNRSQDENEKTNEPRTYATLSKSDKYYIINGDSKVSSKELGVTSRAVQKWRIKIQDEIAQGKL